ncbi:MAG TPA: exosortase H-associated membrane protein [Xanthomonadales bacterium]|nr:exosortase H-associated membrane protein [Xanthomonadales bacterium]
MNQPISDNQPEAEAAAEVRQDQNPPAKAAEELKLSELLILASMWMLFGFMLWFYLSAFHGAPARMLADYVLSDILGDSFRQIIVEPNQNFLFQVETNIQYVFKDGTQEALGFIVNPLVYSYGLPLLFGLVMGSDVSWLRKGVIMLIGYVTITLVQVWGVVFQSLKMLAFNFGEQSHVYVTQAGVSDDVIALGYQLGTLIFPALMPIFVWVLTNRPLVEQFVGWSADALRKDGR